MRGRALLVALVVALVGGALATCDSSSNHGDFARRLQRRRSVRGTNYFANVYMAPATACPEGYGK